MVIVDMRVRGVVFFYVEGFLLDIGREGFWGFFIGIGGFFGGWVGVFVFVRFIWV